MEGQDSSTIPNYKFCCMQNVGENFFSFFGFLLWSVVINVVYKIVATDKNLVFIKINK
jgi:hypothetical protein